MKRFPRPTRRRGVLVVGLTGAVVAGLVAMGSGAGPASGANALKLAKQQQRILSGFASFELSQSTATTESNANTKPTSFRRLTNTGSPTTSSTQAATPSGCPSSFGDNVNVSQNCLNITDPDLQGRGQAQNETAIAQNPNDPNGLVATYNDYRRGDGTCGQDFSTGGGTSWQDATTPNGFVRGTVFGSVAREYFQASGDPSIAWDTKGNAYYDCMMFQRGQPTTNNPDASSGIYMFRSTGTGGGSWNFTGRPVVQQLTTAASQLPLLDKPYMTIDDNPGSRFKDRIYVTWTLFQTDGSARIYEAFSNDYGETFSSPVLITGTSNLCTFSFTTTAPGNCDNSSFSQPFTGPDGALYVVFANYNTVNPGTSTTDNHYQVLLAKSTNGGRSFRRLVKVADFNDLPDCPTYQGGQDPFRSCVPEKGSTQFSVFRATNYPSAGVNPTNPSQIVVTFASYINQDSNPSNGCTPTGFNTTDNDPLYTGVKTAGACNNKIVYSVSNNSGRSFTGTQRSVDALPVVNQDAGQQRTDQYFQWSAFNGDGKLAVSYFDRQYGSDETSGASDVSLSSSSDLTTFATQRVTTSSMPVPTQFPDAQGNSLFYGDYSGLSVANGTAHPLWMDTRNPDLFLCPGSTPPAICTGTEPNGLQANDQRVYTAAVPLP